MQNKICLVRPICSSIGAAEIPLSLLVIGKCLELAHYDVVVKDYDNIKFTFPEILDKSESANKIAEDIISTACKYVLISTMCSNFPQVISIARKVKIIDPSIIIILGGPHPSMCYTEIIKAYDCVDFISIGEGEITIVELLSCIEENGNLNNILGICYRYKNIVKVTKKRPLLRFLDESPIPAYNLINVKEYYDRCGFINIYIGSGCPYNCTFCTTSIMWERHYRTKSVSRVLEEIELLIKLYNVRQFDFVHDNLSADSTYITELLQSIINNKYNISFEVSSRIDTINSKIIRLLAEAGCNGVFFGIETGTEKMQKLICKNININNALETLRECEEYGIMPTAAFIIGFPEEEQNDLIETIKLAFRCRVSIGNKTGISLLSVYTGSPLSYSCFDNLVFNAEYNNNFALCQELTENEIKEIKDNKFIYLCFYLFKEYRSGLGFIKTKQLYDFLTIYIEQFPTLIDTLINILYYSPIDIFFYLYNTVENINVMQKDELDYKIDMNLLNSLIQHLHADKYADEIRSAFLYDSEINDLYLISIQSGNTLYWKTVKSKINFEKGTIENEFMYKLIVAKAGVIFIMEINEIQYDYIFSFDLSDNSKELFEIFLKEDLQVTI